MRLAGATIVTLLALASAGCGRRHEQARAGGGTGEASPAPRDVATATVTRSGGNGELAVPGVVQARKRASLSARMSASVVELPYEEGQSVKAGVLLVRLDDSALHAAASAAEAARDAAEADLARAKALLAKGAATPRELEQATAAASGARAQLTAARDNLSYTALRAPFAGRVAARRVNLGDVVNPGMPLIEVEGDGGLELKATVESALAGTLRAGSKLRAQVDGQPSPVVATVTAISPSGDPTTHRFEVKADLPASPQLRAGLFARLLVPGAAAEPRLAAPADAVFERGGLTGVFVVDGDKARLRWIAVGARDAGSVEVRAGLQEGERVVLRPSGLVDGALVREQQLASATPAGPTTLPARAVPPAGTAR